MKAASKISKKESHSEFFMSAVVRGKKKNHRGNKSTHVQFIYLYKHIVYRESLVGSSPWVAKSWT